MSLDDQDYVDFEESMVRQRSLRERPPQTKQQLQQQQQQQPTNTNEKRIQKLKSKFLEDFDPEKSTREKRKLKRKNYNTSSNLSSRTSLFDEMGRYRSTGHNICDCLENLCPGCHFPCSNCNSGKCGSTCRVGRKWAFESIEHDGKDLVIKNKNIPLK